MTALQLNAWFVYHAPTDDTKPRYEAIRKKEEDAHVVVTHALNGVVWDDAEKELRPAKGLPERFAEINRICKELAQTIEQHAPGCADTTVAVRAVRLAKMYANEAVVLGQVTGDAAVVQAHEQLRQARFWANAAIACGGI